MLTVGVWAGSYGPELPGWGENCPVDIYPYTFFWATMGNLGNLVEIAIVEKKKHYS